MPEKESLYLESTVEGLEGIPALEAEALLLPQHLDPPLFGLPDHWVSFGFLATRSGTLAIWIAQFAIILAAHLLAVVLGLKIAQRFAGGDRFATHLPMTVLMIGYTVFGLWLLSSPTAG